MCLQLPGGHSIRKLQGISGLFSQPLTKKLVFQLELDHFASKSFAQYFTKFSRVSFCKIWDFIWMYQHDLYIAKLFYKIEHGAEKNHLHAMKATCSMGDR